jgi:hypothetical protein
MERCALEQWCDGIPSHGASGWTGRSLVSSRRDKRSRGISRHHQVPQSLMARLPSRVRETVSSATDACPLPQRGACQRCAYEPGLMASLNPKNTRRAGILVRLWRPPGAPTASGTPLAIPRHRTGKAAPPGGRLWEQVQRRRAAQQGERPE